jgi:hypothetical protein
MNLLPHNMIVSRRSALAGLGTGGLGIALTTGALPVSAQDATPAAMAGHPIIGTLIIVRDITNTTEVPVIVVFTADGSFIDPHQGVAGVWESTGSQSAAMTVVPFIAGGTEGIGGVRGTWEIDAGGETMTGPAAVTILTPDGTVVAQAQLSSRATWLHVESMDKAGTGRSAMPVWTPATPEAGTPTS